MAAGVVNRVGVVGTGVMAQGISQRFANKEVMVTVVGRSAASLDRARQAMDQTRALAVRRKRLHADAAEAASKHITLTTRLEDLRGCQLVIETVVEDLEVKRGVFASLGKVLAPETLVCTNTSALSIADVGRDYPHPGALFGLHFMNPVPASKVVELVATPATAPTTLDAARAVCARLGLQVVEVSDVHGFIVNRLLMLWINEAARLVEEGVATPQTVDKAIRLALGHPMGPASVADFIGLDTVVTELETLAAAFGERYAPTALLRELAAQGSVGHKGGGGLLRYRP